MPKLTPKQAEEIMDFVKELQSQLSKAMLIVMNDVEKATEMTVHTEYLVKDKDGETKKFLISSTIQPLTEELKREITGNNAPHKELQDELPPSEKLQDTKNTEGN